MKSIYLLFATFATFLIGAVVGDVGGFNPFMSGGALVAAKVFVPTQVGAFNVAVGFDLTAFNTSLGAFFRNKKELMKLWTGVFQGLEFHSYMTKIGGVTDEYVTGSATISDILQPYQSGWTPKGTASFRARINKVRPIKVDYEFEDLDELYQSWLAEMADETSERKNWPFVKFVVYDLMVPKIKEELEAISYNGVYQAPTAGTASPYLDTTDGIGTIIANEITAGNITPINTGALTATNMVDKTEFFIDNIPHKYRHVSGVIFMSKTNAMNYYRDFRANFGGNNNYNGNETLDIPHTGKKVVGIVAMEGSDRMFFTPKTNMVRLYDKIVTPGNFQTQQDKRKVFVFTDFKAGFGFKNLDIVFANDQA